MNYALIERRITLALIGGRVLILGLSVAMAQLSFEVAHRPMTAEWYADACGRTSECYPEIGYLLGAVVLWGVAVLIALFLLRDLAREAETIGAGCAAILRRVRRSARHRNRD
jgi:hypothetical protein